MTWDLGGGIDVHGQLSELPDDQLERLEFHLHAFTEAVYDDPLATKEAFHAAVSILGDVGDVRWHRTDLAENARIQLVANGHEVWVDPEPNAQREGRWWAFCHCQHDPSEPGHLGCVGGDGGHERCMRSRQEAVKVAADHAAEHGGAWMD